MIHVDELPVKIKTYSDGSLEVINSAQIHQTILNTPEKYINIIANIKSSDDLMALILVKGVVDRSNSLLKLPCILKLPYVPYMRSDRAMNEYTDVGGLKIVAPLINNLNFDSVVVFDPHSDVTESLIKNIRIVPQHEALGHFQHKYNVFDKYDFFISPDAGALKKVAKCAKTLSKPHIEAFKEREINTNKILRTSVNANKEQLEGKSVLIIDDICEGGRTFMALAKMLKEDYDVREVALYVSHGLFTFGYEHLKEHIDQVYCYHSWLDSNQISQTNDYIIPKEYYQ